MYIYIYFCKGIADYKVLINSLNFPKCLAQYNTLQMIMDESSRGTTDWSILGIVILFKLKPFDCAQWHFTMVFIVFSWYRTGMFFMFIGYLDILFIKYIFSPGWCASLDWTLACEPKGHRFDSQPGHMPGLWARSPVGSSREATTHWCFSLILPPFPSLKIKKIKKTFLKSIYSSIMLIF